MGENGLFRPVHFTLMLQCLEDCIFIFFALFFVDVKTFKKVTACKNPMTEFERGTSPLTGDWKEMPIVRRTNLWI